METGHPSIGLLTRAVNSGSGNRALGRKQRQAKVQGLVVECDHYQTLICIL